MKANATKSVQVTFTPKKIEHVSPLLHLNNKQLTHTDNLECMGIHLDRKLTWLKHIPTKRKQPDLKLRKLYWTIDRKSQLAMTNKLLVHKAS